MIFINLLMLLLQSSYSFEEYKLYKAAEEKINQDPAWSNSKIRVLESDVNFSQFKKRIPLTIVILKRSSWKKEQVLSEIRKTEKIYGDQCGIKFSPITLINTKAEIREVRAWVTNEEWFSSDVLKGRPVVFFDRSQRYKSTSFANPEYVTSGKDMDSAFVMYFSYKDQIQNPLKYPEYSILAHELAHVLMNSPHNEIEENILCGTRECKGTLIEEYQCLAIKERFFIK